MHRSRLRATLASLALLVSACSPAATSECSGCTSAEFCCLGACAPLGASCGGSDAGPIDAAVDDSAVDAPIPDAPDRCAPPASATSVESVCVGDTRTSCTSSEERSCLTNERTCLDWIDEGGVAHASCIVPRESELCDPAIDAPRCEGRSIVSCLARSTGPVGEPQPPGYVERFDCGTHAADATCQLDGARPVCFSPSDVPCDPESYEQTCDAYCQLAPYTEHAGVLRPYLCRAGQRCVLNEWSFDRPACVPTSATPSDGPSTGLTCADTSTIHVRRYGYEFDEPCSETVIGGDASRCYDAPPDDVVAQCIGERSETCDPSTYAASCETGNRSRYCTPSWWVTLASCPSIDGSLLTPGPCDAATGFCVVGAPCDPETFVPYCASPSYRISCSASGRTTSFGPFACP